MLAVHRAGYISNLELRATEVASITKTNRQSGVEDPANWPAKPVRSWQIGLRGNGGSKDCRAAQIIGRAFYSVTISLRNRNTINMDSNASTEGLELAPTKEPEICKP
jgi:hypothetical protein